MNRKKLVRLLGHVGVGEKVIKVIEDIHEGNKAKFAL